LLDSTGKCGYDGGVRSQVSTSKWPVVLLPGVVGCGRATTHLGGDDRVRVGGGQGLVEILCQVSDEIATG
jgi:hypothetical protein